MGTFVQELFRTGLYKRSQGRVARQVTMAALWVIVGLGGWRLNVWLGQTVQDEGWLDQLLIHGLPFGLIALGFWAAFRTVHLPSFADFLISVEAEMNKVSWPSRAELVRASLVVIAVMFFLAAVLFFYDIFWKWLLELLNILRSPN